MKKKIAPSNCLGVPRHKGEIVLITVASDVGGVGTIYQWQELDPAELAHCHYRTSGLSRDGSLKHDYPSSEWRLYHWDTGTSNGTRHVPITAPTTRSSWLVCWCPHHRPDY